MREWSSRSDGRSFLGAPLAAGACRGRRLDIGGIRSLSGRRTRFGVMVSGLSVYF
jgi:hypothetical protein